ncbi:NAD-glutamate dehydrogenase [Chitinivorax sp. B]|uniref:NAD-glutamate dehydrogenase n=1 Tax=Chitinivorax sp. B TaxID=2502235 RepID=UPI0010F83E2A|nr:NAD-glutamate dehydrogenase [Chitinivorax sp. B]
MQSDIVATKLLDQICAAGNGNAAPGLTSFLEQYYRLVATEDLESREALDWYGAALAHYQFGAKRPAGELKLRVYNPSFNEDNWQTSHTVVEIINDDMPFLVDTVSLTLQRLGLNIHLIIHPIFDVNRDGKGQLSGFDAADTRAESWMHVEIDRISGRGQLEEIHAALETALTQLRACVEDWPTMATRLEAVVDSLPKGNSEAAQAADYLTWLRDEHFVFLGFREYELTSDDKGPQLKIVNESGLGMLREAGEKTLSASFKALPLELRDPKHPRAKQLMVLTKSNSRSTVHRSGYLDVIALRRFDAAGNAVGEYRFLGLYTAAAYNTPPHQIPLLSDKIDAVMKMSGLLPNSHKAKALLNVLETYPRDELIEASEETLFQIALGVVNLQERSRVRVFIREDIFRRYVSALVYLPRDTYNTDVRIKMQQILLNAFNGVSAEFNVMLSEAALARIHFIVRIPTGAQLNYDAADVEAQIVAASRRWADDLRDNLLQHAGEERGNALLRRYQNSFPAAYLADFNARNAVVDIDRIESCLAGHPLELALSAPNPSDTSLIRLKLYRSQPIELSDSLPLLENLGVRVTDERPYKLLLDDGRTVSITDIGLRMPQTGLLHDSDARRAFQHAFAATFTGLAENDPFNRLVLLAGLQWREVVVLRAYSKYLRQIGFNYTIETLADTLARHADLAKRLAGLFNAMFEPAQTGKHDIDTQFVELKDALQKVDSVDDERILSGLFNVIKATLRTNFFQPAVDGQQKPYISFKLSPRDIPNMPQPVPMFEIWVYSPRVEGVHLRGGKVARGGLRWSDRKEDFRTEVLGLVKAQMVKNTVIVPVGSKGGFVCKQMVPGMDRDAVQVEGVECYKTFIRGLLDVTDNLKEGKVVPPLNVVRRDQDDPYLVVAADKGTATFSDIANSVSQEYGFWLDDAFASGGSAGYDHKKMGITARGAWESVKRQFREMGVDTQQEVFTVAGIGDMAGDVFGNGMLNSPFIKLVAAFNHMHIFLDPNPDVALSFKERQRMFVLPRSSWEDYNRDVISEGGGIFSRSAKTIPLSPQVKAMLQVEVDTMTPAELMNAILKAPVDLLYNGGIGTYVKCSTQTHAEAADRANDPIRVNGGELRCKMVGEGGNLGCTQLGRVEYALNGGRIYTDAIDNSGGVDCSDHEVNIKILLTGLMQAGDMTLKQRNQLLAEMTDEVGQLVLRNNYLQTQAISLEAEQSMSLLPAHIRLMHNLEKAGKLSRRLEYLPNDDILAERRAKGQGITKPELAVLLAYSKIDLYQDLLASTLPDAQGMDQLLFEYFPKVLGERFPDAMKSHALKREIIANHVINETVNRMGCTFVVRLREETDASSADIVLAWRDACRLLNAERFWQDIEALDGKATASAQHALHLELRKQLERLTRWVLRERMGNPNLSSTLETIRIDFQAALAQASQWLGYRDDLSKLVHGFEQNGIPSDLAKRLGYLDAVVALLDVVLLAKQAGSSVDEVAVSYFRIDELLSLTWLRANIDALPRESRWQTLARMSLRDELYREQRALVERVLKLGNVDNWLTAKQEGINGARALLGELMSEKRTDITMLSAALRELRIRFA